MRHALMGVLVVLSGCAMQTETSDVEGQVQAAVEAASCRVRGMGALEDHEFFVARARASEDDARGILVHWGAPAEAPGRGRGRGWHHAHGRRDHFVGHADGLRCRLNGSKVADVEGTGHWNGEGDHVFRLRMEELEDPSVDFYRLTVIDPDGALVYTVSGDVVAGRIKVIAEL